jgi:hypothetical protein
MVDPRDADLATLRATVAEREKEVARLRLVARVPLAEPLALPSFELHMAQTIEERANIRLQIEYLEDGPEACVNEGGGRSIWLAVQAAIHEAGYVIVPRTLVRALCTEAGLSPRETEATLAAWEVRREPGRG